MIPNPLALIAEVTHRCPLHCVYCSNPLKLVTRNAELSSGEWARVFEEAAQLGVLHLHLTGGEPAARSDLESLILAGHQAGLYTNLITSGIGISVSRLSKIVEAGLDHIQLSFQDSQNRLANWIAGAKAHAHKISLARAIHALPVAFTVNLVVHRQNLDHIDEMIEFTQQLEPQRVEVAHAQYYGWALKNRDALLPTSEQLEKCLRAVEKARQCLAGKMRIDSVVPDYYARYPKACMGGWGQRILLIDPSGRALPCHAAGVLPGLHFDNVREHPLEWIWTSSDAFQKFRGEGWMSGACKNCERRFTDFGGCRCQAFLVTGNASATDPVCSLSPDHDLIKIAQSQASRESERISLYYRSQER